MSNSTININIFNNKDTVKTETPPEKNSDTTELSTGRTRELYLVGLPVAAGIIEGVSAQDEEGTEVLNWYLDGQFNNTGKYFYIAPWMSGSSVECRSATATKSLPITETFQNITLEEHEHSFIKQFGNFTIHSPQPADRMFSATAKAYAFLNTRYELTIGGNTSNGGVPPDYFETYLKANGSEYVFTTEQDIAVLVPVLSSNRLLVWGANVPTTILYPLSDIQSVYCCRAAMAFIYRTITSSGHTIGALGNADYGATIPDSVHLSLATDSPVAIYASGNAFAVLTTNGRVHAWGHADFGGTINDDAKALLSQIRVVKIFSTASAFCAVGENGELVTWGNPADGGNISAAAIAAIYDDGGAATVVAAQTAFCALTRTRRKAVSWGHASHGGTMNEQAASLANRGDIILCKAAAWAFCIINQDGLAEAWGNPYFGGSMASTAESGISQPLDPSASSEDEPSNPRMEIKALFSNTLPIAPKPRQSVSSRYLAADGEINIYANDASFCVISCHPDGRTRNIICWGYAAFSALANSTKQILLASTLQQVCCSNGAYAALTTQGSQRGCVVAWGAIANDGGALPVDLRSSLSHDVLEIYSMNALPVTPAASTTASSSSFAARLDNTYVFWGAAADAGSEEPLPGG